MGVLHAWLARSARMAAEFERPYPPGWLDRLTDWIDRMPGPNSLYCLILLIFQFGWVTGLLWLNGKVPVGTIDVRLVFFVVVAPYLLWVRFYLDRVAGAALDAFRSVLAVSEAEFLRLRYELTTLPARTTRVVTLVTVPAFLLNTLLLLPGSTVGRYGSSSEAALRSDLALRGRRRHREHVSGDSSAPDGGAHLRSRREYRSLASEAPLCVLAADGSNRREFLVARLLSRSREA